MRPKPGPLVAIAVLALTFLAACGGEEPPLTMREYAEAMEDAFATLQEDTEKLGDAAEQALEDWFEEVGGPGGLTRFRSFLVGGRREGRKRTR